MSLGFVFPGQGAQFVGMLADLAGRYAVVRERFDQAADAIGLDLWRIASQGPETELVATAVTQPALLTASVALWDVWRGNDGPAPALVAGHSLGEYSALVCAGALDFADAVYLVHRRGQLMQEAVPRGQGAMAAVLGLDEAQVEAACSGAQGLVSAANYNAPGQVVIAGEVGAVGQAVANCKASGARRAVMLEVSGPFHCALMAPAREQLAVALDAAGLKQPQIPLVRNVDAAVVATASEARAGLLEQLARPVRWTECVRRMAAEGVTRLVECGPGKVLTGLAKRIDRSLAAGSIGTLDGLAAELGAHAA